MLKKLSNILFLFVIALAFTACSKDSEMFTPSDLPQMGKKSEAVRDDQKPMAEQEGNAAVLRSDGDEITSGGSDVDGSEGISDDDDDESDDDSAGKHASVNK